MEDIFRELLEKFLNWQSGLTANFLQYHHRGSCITPCIDCPERDKRIYENGSHVKLPAHSNCDCYYTNVEAKSVGSISKRQPAPDVWLKYFGKLPGYYITKQEAMEKYGWNPRRNTLEGKAPGKMIGDELYDNKEYILPEKEGRIWKYCDIDYESGSRDKGRLYYSNDGLMFYSPDHLAKNVIVYQII